MEISRCFEELRRQYDLALEIWYHRSHNLVQFCVLGRLLRLLYQLGGFSFAVRFFLLRPTSIRILQD